MKSKVLTYLLTFFSCVSMHAQTGKLFDADKQLSSSFTSQVYLDRDGFLWIASRNGLNKYDGYQFHIIKKEQANGHGMASNYVNCMTQDENGLFYLGMYGALQTFDGSHFVDVEVRDLQGNVVPCYMTCFFHRKNGELLAGTSGHGVLKITDSKHAVQQNGALRNIHTVQAMEEDRQGHLWMVTDNQGLIEYDGKTIKSHFDTDEQRGTMRRLCLDQQGNLYVGTSNHGVYVRSVNGGEFHHLEVTGNKHVSALYCRQDGQMMIGYDGLGVAVLNPRTGAIVDNPYFSRDVNLAMSKVYSIVEDTGGNIWLGLLQKGIYMQPKETSDFDYMGYKLGAQNVIGQACVVSTFIDSHGRCWVGTDKDGVYCLDDNQRPIKHFTGNGFPATVLSIAEDRSGRIWVSSYGEGFGYIDAQAVNYHQFPKYVNSSGFTILTTSRDELWVATMGQGLLRIDISGKSAFGAPESIKAYTMHERAGDNHSINSISNDYISKMSISPDEKRIYAATTMGVCCYDIERNSWTSFFGRNCLNYGTPTRIAKEYGGRLWIGTNDGLFCYDIKKKDLKHYTTEKGLADNGIASIEQDRDGRLWIGTDHGLCCHNPKTGLTQSYFVDNGLQSNEFSDGASCAIDRGSRVVMLFGGVGGITWFHPERIYQSKWNAKVRLVSFIIGNEPVNSSTYSEGYQVCDTTVIAASRFDLSHHDNTFAVQFSTLTYDNPEHITYLYSINGEPFTRLHPGTNEMTFSHLPPGTYKFSVKAERNGIQTAERTFTVVVHSPWYKSTMAYVIYILLLGFFIWQYILYRRRKMQNRLRIQEHIHAEEMADAKLRFFMNISHEIRTPMTLIVTPLLSLMKQDDDPHRRSVYDTIRRNAERILGLINQMMDLRKIDKGQMQMRMCQTDLIGFVADIYELFSQQAKVKNIQFLYDHDVEKLPVWIDRGNFDKVIVNIISNAFKFTPPGGEISIHVTHSDQHARIVVSDNGEAIPESKLPHIFERFYQVQTAANDRNIGTGIGLDLTRSLVELHHGTIEAHNHPDGKGCEFVVCIPLGKDHLKPDEIIENEEEIKTTHATSLMDELEDIPVAPVTVENDLSNSRRKRLIIVEDDEDIRDYLVSELQSDYDVVACKDGREGLAETLKQIPDLVISDIMMPEMDGNTLCSKIKSSPTTNHVPVILLTAKTRDEDQLEGLQTGADAYIVKPFNMEILRHTVINLIQSHRMLKLKYGRNDQLEEQVSDVKIKSPDEKLLERVMNVINKNLSNSDLSVDAIADEVGISRVHLHRKMKELTGQTPHDFIRNIRLKRAAQLLTNQNMNITEVMYACGFNNAASFSTIFKKFYGLSPRDFMREHSKR